MQWNSNDVPMEALCGMGACWAVLACSVTLLHAYAAMPTVVSLLCALLLQPLLPLSDDAIIDRLVNTYLAQTLPGGPDAASTLGFKDASVLRFRNAVTRFSPGSHEQLPGISTSIPNLYVAGDCVKQGPGTHGCKGLSQEKAYVTGLQVCERLTVAEIASSTPLSRLLDAFLGGGSPNQGLGRMAARGCRKEKAYVTGLQVCAG